MFLKSFTVKNFKCHKNSVVPLFPITVFVGGNGGGKSALFDAIINFSMLSRGRINEAFGFWPFSFDALRFRGATGAVRISYNAILADTSDSTNELDYTITYSQVGPQDKPSYNIQKEVLVAKPSGKVIFDRDDQDASPFQEILKYVSNDRSFFYAVRSAQLAKEYVEHDPLVTHCARNISRVNRFRLDPQMLKRPGKLQAARPDDSSPAHPPFLDYGGEDLSAVLYYLREIKDPTYSEIEQAVGKVIDGLGGFDFNFVGSDRVGLQVRFTDARGTVAAANLSDGTLSLIGHITLLSTSDRPPILCLEEPENGLTPRATRAIYEAIKSLVQREPGQRSQVLLSSHSPFVICDAWNGEDRDFIYQVRPDGGASKVRLFSEALDAYGMKLKKGGELGLQTAQQVMDGYKGE